MGTIIIDMPKLSDTMEEGTVIAWKKKAGDPVAPGDVLAEIESDKATMELEAFDGGYLRQVFAGEGPVAVRDLICANAGAGLYVTGLASSVRQGVEQAKALIESGEAAARVASFVEATRRVSG